MQRFFHKASLAALASLCIYGSYATFWNIFVYATDTGWVRIAAAAAAAVALLWFLWRQRDRLETLLTRAGDRLAGISWTRWLLIVLPLALGARVIWFLAFPAEPHSDGLTYLEFADSLLAGEYGNEVRKAYWPPGFPLTLTPFVAVIADYKHAAFAHDLVFTVFFIAYFSALCRQLLTDGSAKLVLLIACLWPELATITTAMKEYQVTVFLAGAAFHYLRATTGRPSPAARRGWHALASGLLIGAGALTQPGTALLIGVLAIALIILAQGLKRTAIAIGAAVIGMVLVISPWTVRNYLVLDAFVPISTTSGSVLYRANHDLANAGFLKLDVPYWELGEVAQSARLAADARAWIAENPGKFAELVIRKQLNFLGRHAAGLYWSVRHEPLVSDAVYGGMRLVLALFSLALYGLIAVRIAAGRWHGSFPYILFTAGAFTYLLLVDSLFEAGGRHFVPLVALLLPVAFGRRRPDEPAGLVERRSPVL